MSKKELTFLKYGLPSDLVNRLLIEKLTVSSIRNTSSKTLVEKFNLDKEEVRFIKKCIVRKPIANSVVNDLLINNNFTCCCCLGQKGKSFIIHHIEEHEKTQDDSYNNLALLCPVCHDLAHSTRGLTLTISKEQLKIAKESWEKASKQKRQGFFDTNPIFETWQTKYSEYHVDSELNYLFDLTLKNDENIVKGYFNLIYLERGNIFLAGEFSHTKEGVDFDIDISFWEMQWGIRSSEKYKSRAILNYINEDLINWRNLDNKIANLPMIMDLYKMK
jgi:hypothetical protein